MYGLFEHIIHVVMGVKKHNKTLHPDSFCETKVEGLTAVQYAHTTQRETSRAQRERERESPGLD